MNGDVLMRFTNFRLFSFHSGTINTFLLMQHRTATNVGCLAGRANSLLDSESLDRQRMGEV